MFEKPLIYIDFKSFPNILTSPILYQNFCSPKNIRTFLRTVREPSEFGRALLHSNLELEKICARHKSPIPIQIKSNSCFDGGNVGLYLYLKRTLYGSADTN